MSSATGVELYGFVIFNEFNITNDEEVTVVRDRSNADLNAPSITYASPGRDKV